MIEEDYETAVLFMEQAHIVLDELISNRSEDYLHSDDRVMIKNTLILVKETS